MFYAGLILFFATHLIPTISNARFHIVQRVGLGGYLGLYSVASLTGILLIIFGYENSNSDLFGASTLVVEQSKYLMFIAFVFLAAAYSPGYIRKISKHPMLIGVAIWAGTHLLMNPDPHSVVLFGAFLLYSVATIARSHFQERIVNLVSANVLFDILAIVLGGAVTALVYKWHHLVSGVSLLG